MQISDALSLTIAQIVNRWTSSRGVSCDIASVIRAKMSQSFVDKTFVEQEIDQVQRKAGLPCPFQIQMPVKLGLVSISLLYFKYFWKIVCFDSK